MFESEYVKSMGCNFLRIKLDEAPEEKRYQYCILGRGGIGGLLSCSLRLINGDAYLNYDITSRQNVAQMFFKKTIGREWIKDFVWNLKRIRNELNRFLLDESNLIWYPEQIYQELDDNRWFFLYYPYYEGDNGFKGLLEFIIEKVDYSDETLVDFVYKMYEQYEQFGEAYLADKIYQDVDALSENMIGKDEEDSALEVDIKDDTSNDKSNANISKSSMNKSNMNKSNKDISSIDILAEEISSEELSILDFAGKGSHTLSKSEIIDDEASHSKVNTKVFATPENSKKEKNKEKKGLLAFLDKSKKKEKDERAKKKFNAHYLLDTGMDFAVAEDVTDYDVEDEEIDENNGRTVYIERVAEEEDKKRRIFDSDGKMVCVLNEESLVIGKKKDEADVIIENQSVSRVHARIYYSEGEYLLEDLNSTNGTFKNGLRLKPYETKKLMRGDEIKIGSVELKYS